MQTIESCFEVTQISDYNGMDYDDIQSISNEGASIDWKKRSRSKNLNNNCSVVSYADAA